MDQTEKLANRLLTVADSCAVTLTDWTSTATYLNRLTDHQPIYDPAELLLGETSPLVPLMRACGVEESYITGGASDYDRFAALCVCMPRLAGHPAYRHAHDLLMRVCGCALPLCESSAPAVWRQCSERMRADRMNMADVYIRLGIRMAYASSTPDTLPICSATAGELSVVPLFDPTELTEPTSPAFSKAIAHLSESTGQFVRDLDSLTAALETAMTAFTLGGCTRAIHRLAPERGFQRPHPYRANQVLIKVLQGETVMPEEADLYHAQMMRVLGQAYVRRHWHMTMQGGSPNTVLRLSRYLSSCEALPKAVFMADCPLDAASVTLSAAEQGLATGFRVHRHSTRDTLCQAFSQYAARAPIGCLAGFSITISHPIDILHIYTARRVLCECLSEWAEKGMCTEDSAILEEIVRSCCQ